MARGETTPDETLEASDASPSSASSFAHRVRMALGLAAIIGGGNFVVWWFVADTGLEPAEKTRLALKALDAGENGKAYRLGKELEEINYRDPGFSGAVKFILGITTFRDAQDRVDANRIERYREAVRYLRDAERLAVVQERQPEWSFALGVSLHIIGSAEAEEPLRDALASYPPGKLVVLLHLADIALTSATPEALATALRHNTELITQHDLETDLKDRAYLQRAEIFLQMDRPDDVEAALAEVSAAGISEQGMQVFRARVMMTRNEYQDALALLRPVAQSRGLEQTHAREALYLVGVSLERLGQFEAAINAYERTTQRYLTTSEGLASNLRSAELLRNADRTEEALNAYRQALEAVVRPEDFRNRWISREQFRQTILNAWHHWLNAKAYAESIKLSQMMPPLFPEIEAKRMTAQANQLWAETVESEFQSAPFSKRELLEPQRRDRWRSSGEAFAELAVLLERSPDYPQVLWQSADHFRRGGDFEKALQQIETFLTTRPKALLPAALVRRGRLLMDLDRLDEAMKSLKEVAEVYPTDPAAFEARLLIGQCYLEQDEVEKARQTWEAILASGPLEPSSYEWRQALLLLGRLLSQVAGHAALGTIDSNNATVANPTGEGNAQGADSVDPFAIWDEAIDRLQEFLQRYPDDPQATEARYWLARALKQRAERPRAELETAETDTVRQEMRNRMRRYLEQSITKWAELKQILHRLDDADRLDAFGQQILSDCYFETAHAYFILDDFNAAIVEYADATNRYPQDARVLIAYLQTMRCYDQLGRTDEAQSMLKQANVILRKMADGSFTRGTTNLSKDEWTQWLDWAGRIHQPVKQQTAVTPASAS